MVNIAQGMPGLVAEILATAGRAMTVVAIAAEVDRLGKRHTRSDTYEAVTDALNRRFQRHGDVVRIMRGTWIYRQPAAVCAPPTVSAEDR